MRPKIAFITTGGTMDKNYPVGKAYNFVIGEPAVSRVLAQIDPNFEFEVIPLLKKDSSDMTDEDRSAVQAACSKVPGDRIVITHGTDSMTATARALLDIKRKTIVITGSSRPQAFKETDAEFNLGAAIAAVQILPHGVYIAMNGRIYDWNECEKNFETGQFVESNPLGHKRVVAICIAPSAGAPMETVFQIKAVAGQGLEGDRYSRGEGSFNHGKLGSRQVTLINSAFFEGTGFRYIDSRRNLITEGVELMWLIGREFQVGAAKLRGLKYCDPCTKPKPDGRSGHRKSFKQAFSDRGGILAEVIESGLIKDGDAIILPEKGY